MFGKLRIDAPAAVQADQPFPCTVNVADGMPGDNVVVRLWQTAGVKPLYASSAIAVIALDGTGTAIFADVVLRGPCTARLVADDQQSQVPLVADDAHVEVA